MRFNVIEDAAVILRQNGTWRQSKVYRRNGHIYAGVGSGFIRLQEKGGTSIPRIGWDEIEVPFEIEYDKLGRMISPDQDVWERKPEVKTSKQTRLKAAA